MEEEEFNGEKLLNALKELGVEQLDEDVSKEKMSISWQMLKI